jgi:hypothetical protein
MSADLPDKPVRPESLVQARERAIEALTNLFAEDRISMDEFESRLDRLYKAGTPEELDQLTVSAPVRAADRGAGALDTSSVFDSMPRSQMALEPVRPSEVAPLDRMLVIMGETKRLGEWTPPRRLEAFVLMGTVTLDLREARLAPGITEIHVTAIMGEVKVLVPPTIRVEGHVSAIMGSFSDQSADHADAPRGVPILRLTGTAFMAEVGVRVRLPGESAFDAWKRRIKGK